MPIITQLKPQRNKKHVNVYVDGKFRFGIDLDNLYKYKIKVEAEFSEEELIKINKAANFNKTFNKLLNFATLRPRSVKEIKDWFFKKKVDKSFQKKLIKKLEKLELINDEKFARWWITQRTEFKPRSKRALQVELKQKGVDSNLIKKVLSESEIDELKLAKNLAEKKLRTLSRYDEETKMKKLIGFLQRKGFSWDVVKKVIGEASGFSST